MKAVLGPDHDQEMTCSPLPRRRSAPVRPRGAILDARDLSLRETFAESGIEFRCYTLEPSYVVSRMKLQREYIQRSDHGPGVQ